MGRVAKTVEDYAKKFPNVPRENHRVIIQGAIGGENAPMSDEGFRRWYDQIGHRLGNDLEIMNYIRTNPHFATYREAMILGGDWSDIPMHRLLETSAA